MQRYVIDKDGKVTMDCSREYTEDNPYGDLKVLMRLHAGFIVNNGKCTVFKDRYGDLQEILDMLEPKDFTALAIGMVPDLLSEHLAKAHVDYLLANSMSFLPCKPKVWKPIG